MLSQVYERLEDFHRQHSRAPWQDKGAVGSASVLVAITNEQEPKVVLTQRAATLSSHAGQVAFPGGKQDPEDKDSLETALREANEEVGLDPELVEALVPLKSVRSVNQLSVTPWVAVIPPKLRFVANEGELDEVFSVPLQFFLETDVNEGWRKHPQYKRYGLPVWEFQGFVIWGLTAYIIADLLNICFDAGFEISHRATKHKEGA